MQIIENYLDKLKSKNEIKTLEDINELLKLHVEKLLFSNIPVLLQNEISLDLSEIYQKLVEEKKGGYCFEHNKLIYEALLHFGFDVTPLFGRVLNNRKIDVPKTHRFTLLKYENEKYIIDVGFGFMSPNQAIKFGQIATKASLDRLYIIKEIDENHFEMQLLEEKGSYVLYSFDFHNYTEMDFEVGNFYSYKHKDANFVNHLVASKITKDTILSLRNNSYLRFYLNEKQEMTIETLEEFTTILRVDFAYLIEDKDAKFLFERFIETAF